MISDNHSNRMIFEKAFIQKTNQNEIKASQQSCSWYFKTEGRQINRNYFLPT